MEQIRSGLLEGIDIIEQAKISNTQEEMRQIKNNMLEERKIELKPIDRK